MKPVTYFMFIIVTLLAIAGLSQIPLVQDAIAKAGWDPAEIWSGVASIFLVFYTVGAVLTK